jgi:predicted HTH domain antitoxin
MVEMRIPIPEGLPNALKMSDEEFECEARRLLAVKLYEMGRVTAGMAAQIAGMERLSFLECLSSYQVAAINLQDEEVGEEIAAARTLARG